MLTPEEIDALIEPMQPLIDDLNTFILKDIVSRLMARLKHEDPFKLSQSDIWQLEVLKDANAHYEAVKNKLAKWTGKADREIAAIFEDAGITAWDADRAIYEAQGAKTLPINKLPNGADHAGHNAAHLWYIPQLDQDNSTQLAAAVYQTSR